MVDNYGVYLQQQGIYSDKVITVQGQLWMRVKNRF